MIDRARRIVRKYVEFAVTKVRILWEQRIFSHGDVKVKYIFKTRKNADSLVVVFSACTRNGLKARYNYVKTLNGLQCNRLYILDDYAPDHRGSYYIGSDFKFDEEVATHALIQKIYAEHKPKKLIFCGSSKGGYAALNFGLKYAGSVMVVGAPQYYLTSYLVRGNECTLNYITGERTPEKEEKIEYYLRERILNNPEKATQKIYLHYSNKEHTYEEHIKDMLQDLKECGYQVSEDVADYANHSDISYYFPDYLKKCVNESIR